LQQYWTLKPAPATPSGWWPQSRECRTGQALAGKHRDRQVGVARQLFSAMGIERDNKDKRQDWVLRGFRQFDAPVCVIVTQHEIKLLATNFMWAQR
jgi:hypothetical protein